MTCPLIAIVGDTSSTRVFDPVMKEPAKAKDAAEQLGNELAKRGARLLVYGGPFLEMDVVRGFVQGKPVEDRSILMWYTKNQEPPPFPEESNYPKLFERRADKGVDWETAFYRSIVRADGIILIGGCNATKITGQIAIGARIPIITLPEFGGAASKVWDSLSAGEDLPIRNEIDLMARPWKSDSAAECVSALFSQLERRSRIESAPSVTLSILSAILFLAALAIVPLVWGQNAFPVWMLFLAPILSGGAGAAIRPIVERFRGSTNVAPFVLATIVVGLVAGGIAGVLFVTAQLTADPQIAAAGANLVPYAQRSIPFAVGIGFVAGLTSDSVFGKLLGLDVIRTSGISSNPPRT